MKIIKTSCGYSLLVMVDKRRHDYINGIYAEEEIRIEIDEKFQINIPATGSITSRGTKQLIEALELAISLNDEKIIIL